MTTYHVAVEDTDVEADSPEEAALKMARHFGCLADGITPDSGVDPAAVKITGPPAGAAPEQEG